MRPGAIFFGYALVRFSFISDITVWWVKVLEMQEVLVLQLGQKGCTHIIN